MRIELNRLTPYELKVLELVVAGMKNQEIADSLNITLATVKWHINKVMDKTGIHDRKRLIVMYYTQQNYLLDSDK